VTRTHLEVGLNRPTVLNPITVFCVTQKGIHDDHPREGGRE
jgi:hypothetical protein